MLPWSYFFKPRGNYMAVSTFNQYINQQNIAIRTENLNTSYLYAQYIQWLITKEEKDIAVQDLLAQIKVISAFIEYNIIQNSPRSYINNTNLIFLTPLPTEAKVLEEFKETNKTINPVIETYIANTTRADLHYNAQLRPVALIAFLVTAAIAAVFIGAGFAPGLAAAGAITQWTIGAACGALSLFCLKGFVRAHMKVTAERNGRDLALTSTVDKIAKYISKDESTKKAIEATLTSRTGGVLINSNIYDTDTSRYVGEYEGLKPFGVELNRIAPKLV